MASPLVRPNLEQGTARPSAGESSAVRFLSAERPEEILPLLLEEVVVILGFSHALILELDFESGAIRPAASLNCDKATLRKFRLSLWASDSPLVSAFKNLKPCLVAGASAAERPYYAVPFVYSSRTACREAERERRPSCLAVINCQPGRKLQVEEQDCAVCGMRSYARLLLVRVDKRTSQAQLRSLRALVEWANRYLARLTKVEHYYKRLRETEGTISHMGTVMQSMADPVIFTDNQHRVVIQNKASERFFRVPEGVSEGGRRAVELNNLLFSAALSSLVLSASDSSRDLTLVDVMEGEEVLFEAVSAPTFSPDGSRTGMVTVMRDVTDLRRADQEVRANLQKLRIAEEIVRQDRDRLNLVIENVGDPIIVADNAAKIVLLDPLAKELFGSGDAYRGREIVKNQAKLDTYLTSFTFSFAEKENKTLCLYHPETHSEVEYAARSGKIYDARGQVAYTVTVLRDFSTWKKLEQLHLERRMLEMEKFAAMGRLAGTIAHEINNPLEAIKNAIYLLRENLEPASQPIYEVLKSETDRVARIVRQMLGLYRHTGQLGTFDLNGVVEDTLALFGGSLAKSKVRVEKRLGQLPPLKGSADQFRQLLSNLLLNASDAMPEGGKLIMRTRYIHALDGTHGWITLSVLDTGTGIPKNLQPSMFDPFVSTKGEKGTGLGLWIVKGIVENHAGRIQVRSVLDKGTLFKIAFPVAVEGPFPQAGEYASAKPSFAHSRPER